MDFLFFIVAGIVYLIWRNSARKSTKRCRVCGMTIPYTAKRCPHCLHDPGYDTESELKFWFNMPVLRFVANVFGAIIVIGIIAMILF